MEFEFDIPLKMKLSPALSANAFKSENSLLSYMFTGDSPRLTIKTSDDKKAESGANAVVNVCMNDLEKFKL